MPIGLIWGYPSLVGIFTVAFKRPEVAVLDSSVDYPLVNEQFAMENDHLY